MQIDAKKILLIEDEAGIADTILYALSTEGFEPEWVTTGSEGLEKLRKTLFDFIILDIGLPDVSGFELLKEIRKDSIIPVLVLTARAEEVDRVVGLELGADDYMVKPFSPRELTARIRAIFRRTGKRSQQQTGTQDNQETFTMDNNRRCIYYFGQKLQLSRYEYELLSLLIRRPGWVFSREKIMQMIWTEPEESFDRTVDAHIKMIRAKLKEIRDDLDPIKTHRGVGYSLRDDL